MRNRKTKTIYIYIYIYIYTSAHPCVYPYTQIALFGMKCCLLAASGGSCGFLQETRSCLFTSFDRGPPQAAQDHRLLGVSRKHKLQRNRLSEKPKKTNCKKNENRNSTVVVFLSFDLHFSQVPIVGHHKWPKIRHCRVFPKTQSYNSKDFLERRENELPNIVNSQSPKVVVFCFSNFHVFTGSDRGPPLVARDQTLPGASENRKLQRDGFLDKKNKKAYCRKSNENKWRKSENRNSSKL